MERKSDRSCPEAFIGSTRHGKYLAVGPPAEVLKPEETRLRICQKIPATVLVVLMALAGMPVVWAENGTDTAIAVNASFTPGNESQPDEGDTGMQLGPDAYPLYRYFPELDPENAIPANGTGLSSVLGSLPLREGSAQAAITWAKTYGGSENEDQPGIVRRTPDGGYVATVTTLSGDGDVSTKHAGSDIWVVKLDVSGIIQWEKARGGSQWEMAWDIWPTSDGGFIITGTTSSQDGDVSGIHVLPGMTPNLDIWVAKLDSAGNVVWQRCLGGIKYEYPTAVRETPDGGYIVAGYSDSGTSMSDRSDPRGANDAWVVKLSETGGFQWERSFGGASNDYASSVSLTSDGGYVVSGYTESNDAYVTGNHGGLDAWIIKLYSTGDPEWQKCYGGSANDAAYSVQQTPDGGYIVAGVTSSTNGDVSAGLGASDAWVMKLDSTGAIAWEKTFGGSGGDFAQDILRIPGGGYMVAAQTQSSDIPIGGYHGGADILVAELDDTGTLLRELCLGGTSWDVPGNIILAGDGDYMLGGVTYSINGDITSNHGMYDLWIVKHGEGIPVVRPELVVDATDSASSALIPGATISLFDIAHNEWQNVTAATGSYTFTSSGRSQQYALVPGTAYRLAASADGYSPAVRDITFGQDGQRETVGLARIEPEVFTYSVTNNLGEYNQTLGTWTWNENARNDIDYMTSYFGDDSNWNNVRWEQAFLIEGPAVTKGNFGVNPLPGEHTLNEATLHYHAGHGSDWPAPNKSMGLALVDADYNSMPPLVPSDVSGKWGGKNKWVILQSCFPLRDNGWGDAFAPSHATHGILSFKTVSYAHPDFMKTFFEYAKTYTVRDAYFLTVRQYFSKTTIKMPDGTVENLTAVTVFSNQQQAENDYLPGFGSGIQPDADRIEVKWDQWPPVEQGGV